MATPLPLPMGPSSSAAPGPRLGQRSGAFAGAALLLAALLLAPCSLRAQDMDVVQRIEASYQRALAAYEDFELEQAKYQLDAAVRLANTQGVSHPVLARVQLLLGVIVYSLSADSVAAEEAFVAGLRHDATATLDPTLATPELEQILARARARFAPAAVVEPPPPVVEPPPPVAEFPPRLDHSPPARANEGVNLPVAVQAYNADRIRRCLLRYRFPGGGWSEIDLTPQPGMAGRFTGYVPGAAVVGPYLEYTVQALDWSGKPVAEVASEASPLRVPVAMAAAQPAPVEPGFDPGYGRAPSGQDDPTLHLTLGVGTGVGIATGPPLRKPDIPLEPGLAPSPFHFYGEIGVYATRSILFLLAGRVQMVVEESSLIFEPLLSLRARWYFQDVRPLRAFVGAGGGWCGFIEDCGYVQHQVDLNPREDFIDTTRAGNAHAGAEGGLEVDFSEHVGLQTSLFLFGLWGDKASAQADLNLGLTVSF